MWNFPFSWSYDAYTQAYLLVSMNQGVIDREVTLGSVP